MKPVVKFTLHLLFWIIACILFLRFSINLDSDLSSYGIGLIRFGLTITAVYMCSFLFYKMLYKRSFLLLFWYFISVIVVSFSTLEFALTHASVLRSVNEFEVTLINPYLTGIYWGITLRYAFFVVLFMLLRFYEESKRTIQLDKKVYANELYNYLSSKVLPHYLVGVINSLQAMAINSSEKLPELLGELNMLLHYIMTKATGDKVLLTDEISFYCNYIKLEILRYPSPIKVSFEEKNLKKDCKVAPLLFENIINNAFKYTCHDGTGYVKMTLSQNDENMLIFECENNVSPDIPHISYGKGLENLLDRLNLLYHNHYVFDFENKNNMCKVTLQLSLI